VAAFDCNPPVYRARLGAAELTIVSDGTIGFPPTTLLPDVPEDELEAFLDQHHQPTDRVPLQLNAMVVDLDDRCVVIDAGDGGKFDPTAGRLPGHMAAAGLDPDTVDALVLTHPHPDHLWGATDPENEAPVFANAEIVVPEAELAFWDDLGLAASMPSGLSSVRWRRAPSATCGGSRAGCGRFAAPGEAAPGIRFLPTPGHAAVAVESEGELLLSTGDLVGDPFFSFERPDWRFGFDWDPDQGVATRRVAQIDKKTGYLRAVQLLLTKISEGIDL
jgi:glyoxylase-like metal-dependent hydrolase (beta-lactamase superfamily II)